MATETRSHALARKSQSTYESYVEAYARIMQKEFQMDPFPVTEEKLCGFLMFQKTQGRAYATLLCYITAFSWYFGKNELDNVVNSVSFKEFKYGLKRTMMGSKYPHQKAAFDYDFFPKLRDVMHLETSDDRRFFLLMTLSYYFFMRISEIVALRVEDLKLGAEHQLLACHFTHSKTDQFGGGTKCYVSVDGSLTNPAQYLDVLEGLPPEALVSPWKEHALLKRLRTLLTNIGVDASSYSWHSFRRGGAFRASQRGIQDCVIKKHGRWASHAYLRYVAVDAIRAGREVREALTK